MDGNIQNHFSGIPEVVLGENSAATTVTLRLGTIEARLHNRAAVVLNPMMPPPMIKTLGPCGDPVPTVDS